MLGLCWVFAGFLPGSNPATETRQETQQREACWLRPIRTSHPVPLLLLRAAVFSLFSLCSWIPLQAFRVRHLNPSTDAFCSSPITTRSRGDARVDAIGGSPRFGEVAARLINRPDPGWSFCWAGLCREAAWGTRVRARRKGLPPASFSCDAMCLRERAVDCRGAPWRWCRSSLTARSMPRCLRA